MEGTSLLKVGLETLSGGHVSLTCDFQLKGVPGDGLNISGYERGCALLSALHKLLQLQFDCLHAVGRESSAGT